MRSRHRWSILASGLLAGGCLQTGSSSGALTGKDDWIHEDEAAQLGTCVFLIDEEGIDNDMRSIERAAVDHGIRPDVLVNDDRPTEVGNPPLVWNEQFAGDVVRLPTGQVDDEGWFALPDLLPWPLEDFVAGTVPQDRLDKIPDVMPLRNHDLVQLVGRTCVAVVYDSDISMNYLPINANLQGARYGLFTFTVLAVEVPGSLPESGSNTSLYDLWLRIEPPAGGDVTHHVTVRDHEPDSIQIDAATYDPEAGELELTGRANFAPSAFMTMSVDGADAGTDRTIHPSVLEAALELDSGRYSIRLPLDEDVRGRRVTISTDHGGAYNGYVSQD
jgi:hypothetical protein